MTPFLVIQAHIKNWKMEYIVLVMVVVVVLYLFAGEMTGEEKLQSRIKSCFSRKAGKR